jgi:PAS domain S-box-containing protein
MTARQMAEGIELARLAAIVESSDDAIISTGLDGEIQSWNRAAEHIFGYTAEEAIGRHISFLAPEDLWLEESELLQRIGQGEHVQHYRTRRLHKDGRLLALSLSLSPIRAHGQIVGASTISRDISERRRIEELLARQTLELQRSNAELERFAYVASHDLQEPLRTITSFIQLLARRYKGRLDADADEFIAFAVDGANRMKSLIQGLLAYSRVGRRGADEEQVDLGELVDRVIADHDLVIAESGATVLRRDLPIVTGNPTELRQVFHNLIGNCLKFRSEAPPEIQIGAERRDSAWLVTVQDNGIGIDPEYFDRIFLVFQRLHGPGQYPGTGIGLAICSKIIQARGGEIWVSSRPGEGAAFHFTLPDLPLPMIGAP